MEPRPANVNFLGDTSFRFSREFIFLLPNFPAGKDQPRALRTLPDFISARYILPQRSLGLSGFKEPSRIDIYKVWDKEYKIVWEIDIDRQVWDKMSDV